MHTDEDKLFTPWGTLKKGKKFSDHNAIILNLNINPQSPQVTVIVRKSRNLELDEDYLMFIQCILMKTSYLRSGEPSRKAKSFQIIMQLS